jgi:hypothetical protein
MPDGSDLSAQPRVQTIPESLPRSASIIEAFRGVADRSPTGQLALHTAAELAETHQRQWLAEDASRAAGASAESVAAAKRLIDELNARRVSLVELIDEWVAGMVRGPVDASLHTETLGSVIDRLAIAWVRANNLIAANDRDRGRGRGRGRQALSQLVELAAAYDDLVRDVAAGNRRLPAWRPLKTYR